MSKIDLNCDIGEIPEAIADGTQEALMQFLTSVNIACGGHAGDRETMRATVDQALRWKLAIGAHPSYPDRANFGRLELALAPEAIADAVFTQIRALSEAAARGACITHVKPHGALYNQAARDPSIAKAIADGVARYSRDVALIGLAGSVALNVFREEGFRAAGEAFADRRYEPDGSLRSRRFPDALIADPSAASEQALSIAQRAMVLASGGIKVRVEAETICIHSDTPGALACAQRVSETLRCAGIDLLPLSH